MITNSQVQASWISRLKANANITAVVPADEIREYHWKGTNFSYPNIRVKMGILTPQVQSNNCQIFNSIVSILVSSEQKSSKQADDIAGIIATEFWGKGFTSEGIKFIQNSLESLSPAVVPEENDDIWVSTVNLNSLTQLG